MSFAGRRQPDAVDDRGRNNLDVPRFAPEVAATRHNLHHTIHRLLGRALHDRRVRAHLVQPLSLRRHWKWGSNWNFTAS